MRKEVLLAVIFGIILGGIILYGIRLANQTSANPAQIIESGSSTPIPVAEKPIIEVTYPQNHSVLTEKEITLTGRSHPGSTIAIITESDDLIVDVSAEGTFSADINLIGGENTITITALLEDNTVNTETITVIQTANIPE